MSCMETCDMSQTGDLSSRVAAAVRQYSTRTNSSFKQTARRVGAAERTVAGWAAGENPPSAENLIDLAREIPEVQALVLQLIGYRPTARERQLQDAAKDILALLEGR